MKSEKGAEAVRRVTVQAWACTCQRCGHQWHTLDASAPARCAKCKNPRWTQPKVYGGGRKRIPALPDDRTLGGPDLVRESAEQRIERCRVGSVWYYRFLDFKVVDGQRVGGRYAEPESGQLVKLEHSGQSAAELLREALSVHARHQQETDALRPWSDRVLQSPAAR